MMMQGSQDQSASLLPNKCYCLFCRGLDRLHSATWLVVPFSSTPETGEREKETKRKQRRKKRKGNEGVRTDKDKNERTGK
jgi:hypothetical protein